MITSFTPKLPSQGSAVIVLTALFALFASSVHSPHKAVPVADSSSNERSQLAPPPDWQALEIYQKSITRVEFLGLINEVFTIGSGWKNFIRIGDSAAFIRTKQYREFQLDFAAAGQEITVARDWRNSGQLPEASVNRPLDGLKIAIDPGHIGGAWAKMEERWLSMGGGRPICEGDMTLAVAKILKPRLERLGAVVTLVRTSNSPVTRLRPHLLMKAALAAAESDATADQIRRESERLFYRTAEIRARADLVNQQIKPDLVLCLHFNAESWGDPNRPTLIDRNHFHLLVNGAYSDAEVALEDQRYALVQKLLARTHPEEVDLGASVAQQFSTLARLPAYQYPTDSQQVRPVKNQPFLWARNLLANRLYNCPVIFLEPYVMNSLVDYDRMQLGDYSGRRQVHGEMRSSIFREYAAGVEAGLIMHYKARRKFQ